MKTSSIIPPHYFTLLRKKETLRILETLSSKTALILIWKKNMKKEDVRRYFISYFDSKKETLVLKKAGPVPSTKKQDPLLNQNVFIKCTSDSVHYFSTGNLHYNRRKNEYYIKLQKKFYKCQRRKHFRLRANVYNDIEVFVGKKVYKGLDISPEGTSFLVPISKLKDFEKGKNFKDFSIMFNKQKFSISMAKIVGVVRVVGEAKLRISVHFKMENERQDEIFYQYVILQARKDINFFKRIRYGQ